MINNCLEYEKLIQGRSCFNKARKIFYTFITKAFIFNSFDVNNIKVTVLIISTLFLNFTNVFISPENCSFRRQDI